MFRRTLFSLFLLLLPAVAMAGGTSWMHLRIVETDGDDSRVSVNVPLSLVETLAALIPDHECRRGAHIRVNSTEVDATELREAWRAVRGGLDDKAISLRDNELRVWKNKGRLVMQSSGHHETATVVMPAAVADALLRGEGNDLDLLAAVRTLAATGQGEITVVTEDDDTVRIWVDTTPEGGRR